MATSFDAKAVKSLNESSSRKRFTFKSFGQRVAEIDINVYRCLDPLKSEPSEGSSFFRDSLAEWRELNTSRDFISFYEEIFPLVQTLPQIILQKELILSKILDRLQMKCRLSLEPLFSLIAALSRDLLEDLLPFLPRVVDSLVSLLTSGADREPEIMEQIFTSWSCIMMYMQRYLITNLVHVLKVTRKLRYYPKDYVREFVAESLSFLFRNASLKQLIKGTRKILREVARKPSASRKSSASELLRFTLRGTSSKLHSRAEVLLRLLLDKSLFDIVGQEVGDSDSVVEVMISTFGRLSEELEPNDLNIMLKCVIDDTTDTISSDSSSVHLSRLLSLLVCASENGYMKKASDYHSLLQLARLLVKDMNRPTQVIDKVFMLLLCIVDGFYSGNVMQALYDDLFDWTPVFSVCNNSLFGFLEGLLLRDVSILMVFRTDIIRALNDLLEVSEAAAINLLLIFIERLHMPTSGFLKGVPSESSSKLCSFLRETLLSWTGMIINAAHGSSLPLQFEESGIAILWAAIKCYPYILNGNENHSVLLDLLNALDKHLATESGFPKTICQSLIGAIMESHSKTLLDCENGADEAAVGYFMSCAIKYPSSSHILSATADILDSAFGIPTQEQINFKTYLLDLQGRKTVDALKAFAENLFHCDKQLRLSSLRILSHYEHSELISSVEQVGEKEVVDSISGLLNKQGGNVLGLLLLIESIPLSIKTSRRVILLLSRLQMSISTGRLSEQYVPALLYGIIGIFHTRFSYVWNPAVDCLAMVISQHVGCIWDTFVHYLDSCQSVLLLPHDQSCRISDESLDKAVDLVGHFSSYVSSLSDSTPSASVFSLLLQSLQKVPSLVESRTRQIVPLFLKFLGYDVDELKSVGVYMLQNYVHKEWKEALKEWLNLFRLMRNPKSFFREHFLKEVFLYRLLDDNDTEIQSRVLDCLLNWKDEFLVSYNSHLRNLISAKNVREELTTWSLSKESNLIDEKHRPHVVPIVIRILVSKVRKLKTLASTKHSSVHNRRAILGFLAQLEVNELSLLFDLLIKPLQTAVQGANESDKCIPISPESLKDRCSSLTVDDMKDLSWKKMYSFLHVIEEVFEVFDQWRINSFLKLLMGCVVCILECCTMTLEHLTSVGSTSYDPDDISMVEQVGETTKQMMASTNTKQLKELRSLCIKITSSALNKYENYSFGDDFWERFFGAVKPLITGFKQEGASSERANSLFSCFLAMSKSLKFIPLLSHEKNLVPDIFSILTVPTASDAVISSVLIFVENLLTLDFELGDEDSSVKVILLPHLDVLIISLHSLFSPDNARHRKLARYLGDKELSILKLLSKYVTDPVASTKFIEILFPLLEKKSQNDESRVRILQIIRHIVPYVGSKFSEKYLTSLSSLLTFVGLEVRLAICDVLNSLAQSDSSVQIVAKILSELNASSSVEIDGLDYDTIICAYEKINKDFFYTVNKEQASILLSHSIYDMSSEEMILRQSAYGMLLNFVYFSLEILNSEDMSDIDLWSEAHVKQLISKLLFKHMGKAMHKETAIQKIWIALLREMVSNIPKVANLESYGILCSEDPEQDFFSNIVHLQKHRRARALLKFIRSFSQSQLSEAITKTVFVPLFFNILFDLQDGKGENVRLACLEALGSISGRMSWKEYRALLMSCFREMNIKRHKQRVLLRLICSILDHFPPAKSNQATETVSSGVSPELADIQTFLQGTLLPKIQKLLSFDSDKVNVNVCLVALKLLKLLPREMMELRLPSIIQRISNLLKNRLDSVREEARAAMAVCLKELGLEYLQVMVQSLRSTLKRGYELHVLGYSVHFLLTKFLVTPSIGKLDYCLDDLLSVAENDILGDVSEQKDVDKIASKMKETRKQKSYDSLKLIAQNITFRTHALKLLSPVMVHLQKQLTPKLKLKLESMLNHIAAGIENNPSVNKTDLFIFVYRLVKDGLSDENSAEKNPFTSKTKKGDVKEVGGQMSDPDRLIRVDPRYSHLVTVFALRLLHNYTKKSQLRNKDENLLSLLDPFVSLLCDCLSSKYEHTVSTAVRCLSSLIGLPLPSLESQANKLKNSLLAIAQGPGNAGSPLMESCLRLLTLLLRNTRITLATDQLHMLIQFPLFIDIERNPSFVALSLLKAIVNRKLVVPEVYDLVKKVAELIVTSQVESVRKKCSQILLQFLMDYHLSEKRLQEHLDFLLSNLGYEHSTGREAVLEMLDVIIMKFPVSVIDQQSQTLFVHLVVCLSNDQDSKVRSMTGYAIKRLIGRVSPPSVHSILEYSLSWYVGEKEHLWSAAAQVLGLLVEVMEKGFQKYNAKALLVIQKILQLSVNSVTNNPDDISSEGAVPLWKEAYYSMVLMEKILLQFDKLYLDKNLEETWERICDLLVHPHMWLRNKSNRLLALYFTHVAEARLETSFIMRPGRLFRVAASLCCQLKTQHVDDTATTFITQNLVFTICHLNFLLNQLGFTDFHKLWLNLDVCEQDHFLRAFQVIDPRKGASVVAYLSSDHNNTQKIELETEAHQHFFVSYLLKKMGKLALQPEFVQMEIILNCFKLISEKLLCQENSVSTVLEGNNLSYAYQLLLPVYKICEGYAGKVISDNVKQLAQEACETIRKDMGMQKWVEVYSNIRTNLKTKRDKRKQQDKLMAVINPMRNAKRKLRVAAKHRTNKRRKIMNMKMGRWMR